MFLVTVALVLIQCTPGKQSEEMHVITSRDGTDIAYEKVGNGPALILVGGALASRADHDKLVEHLSEKFSVYNFDRRGRGDSGDKKPYAVERELEDIEVLIDAAGGTAYLYGISSGACLALEAAAALGNKVSKLAVYEAPYDEAHGAAEYWMYHTRLQQDISADRRGDAVEHHLKFVGVPDVALLTLKVSPKWSAMKDVAPTLLYDIAVVGADRSIPVDRIKAITANTLVVDGGASLKSMPFMRASAEKIREAIPNATRKTLENENHNVSEKAIAPVLMSFFMDGM